MKIRDYYESSPADVLVSIEKRFSQDECDPLREEVYSGELGDVPAELLDVEVLEVGRSMKAEQDGYTRWILDIQG